MAQTTLQVFMMVRSYGVLIYCARLVLGGFASSETRKRGTSGTPGETGLGVHNIANLELDSLLEKNRGQGCHDLVIATIQNFMDNSSRGTQSSSEGCGVLFPVTHSNSQKLSTPRLPLTPDPLTYLPPTVPK